jgi:Ca2+-binding RTX toxin-like protein
MKSMRVKSVLLLLAFAGVGVIGVISYLVLAATVNCAAGLNPCLGTNLADDITNPASGLTGGQIRALAGNDSITDNTGGNTITGDFGNDFIRVLAGVNGTYGNSGNDTIQIGVGAGADQLVELGDGNDNFSDAVGGHNGGATATGCMAAAPAICIFGDAGNDVITTGVGAGGVPSNVDAGAGNDTVNLTLGAAIVLTAVGTSRGGNGSDTITVRNTTGASGTALFQTILGDAGNDRIFNTRLGGAVGNQLFGGDGNDILDCRGMATGAGGPAAQAPGDQDVLDGGFGNDTIFDCPPGALVGNVDETQIFGGPGDDRIFLLADNTDEDTVDAGPGRDLIFVDGDATFPGLGAVTGTATGAPGFTIVCGPDNDTVFLDTSFGAVTDPFGNPVTLPRLGNTETLTVADADGAGSFNIDSSCENIRLLDQ